MTQMRTDDNDGYSEDVSPDVSGQVGPLDCGQEKLWDSIFWKAQARDGSRAESE